jgi:hypothetical protein
MMPMVVPDWLNEENHGVIILVAPNTVCPKCGKTATAALRWTCCNLSVDEAMQIAEDVHNKGCESSTVTIWREEAR